MAVSSHRAAINSSAAHVFEVLRFVAESPEPLAVTEISRRLSLPVSTVLRALMTLEEADYIQRYQNAPHFELRVIRDFHAIALPIRNAKDIVVAALMTEGATREGETIEPSEATLATRHDIEVGLRVEPERFTSPFAHIAPDDIVIRILHPAE